MRRKRYRPGRSVGACVVYAVILNDARVLCSQDRIIDKSQDRIIDKRCGLPIPYQAVRRQRLHGPVPRKFDHSTDRGPSSACRSWDHSIAREASMRQTVLELGRFMQAGKERSCGKI